MECMTVSESPSEPAADTAIVIESHAHDNCSMTPLQMFK